MTVAGLLLAAGAGRRMGRAKALLDVGGSTLLDRGIALLREAGCDPVVVVLGAEAGTVPSVHNAQRVVARDWSEGVGASLRAGLDALAESAATGCVVTLVDQPLISADAVRRLLAVTGRPDAAVATYGGEPQHPVLLDRRVWADVADLARGDVGARAWMRAHPARVLQVACDGLGTADDVDTPADLEAVRAAVSRGNS